MHTDIGAPFHVIRRKPAVVRRPLLAGASHRG